MLYAAKVLSPDGADRDGPSRRAVDEPQWDDLSRDAGYPLPLLTIREGLPDAVAANFAAGRVPESRSGGRLADRWRLEELEEIAARIDETATTAAELLKARRVVRDAFNDLPEVAFEKLDREDDRQRWRARVRRDFLDPVGVWPTQPGSNDQTVPLDRFRLARRSIEFDPRERWCGFLPGIGAACAELFAIREVDLDWPEYQKWAESGAEGAYRKESAERNAISLAVTKSEGAPIEDPVLAWARDLSADARRLIECIHAAGGHATAAQIEEAFADRQWAIPNEDAFKSLVRRTRARLPDGWTLEADNRGGRRLATGGLGGAEGGAKSP